MFDLKTYKRISLGENLKKFYVNSSFPFICTTVPMSMSVSSFFLPFFHSQEKPTSQHILLSLLLHVLRIPGTTLLYNSRERCPQGAFCGWHPLKQDFSMPCKCCPLGLCDCQLCGFPASHLIKKFSLTSPLHHQSLSHAPRLFESAYKHSHYPLP